MITEIDVMGKDIFSGIAIVSDIDGTFLGSQGRIVKRNIDAIKKFNEQGGRFTFATGRATANMKKNIPMISEIVNAPAIMCNGSFLYDYACDKVIEPRYMDAELSKNVIKHINKYFPEVDVRMSTTDKFWLQHFEGYVKRDMMSMVEGDGYFVRDIDEWPSSGWIKFVVRGESDDLDRVRESVKEKFGSPLECTKSSLRFLEYQALGCTKSSAISTLKKLYLAEGSPLTVIAVGDYENDYKMLRDADISVCPSNALSRIKNICDYCLCNHDHGVIADIVEGIENGSISVPLK